jgi:hypothetical protein
MDEDGKCPCKKVEGAVNSFDFRVLILDLVNGMKGVL